MSARPVLLNIKQASEYLNVPIGTLKYWRQKGEGPQSVVIGRNTMYRATELDQWVEAQFAAAKGA